VSVLRLCTAVATCDSGVFLAHIQRLFSSFQSVSLLCRPNAPFVGCIFLIVVGYLPLHYCCTLSLVLSVVEEYVTVRAQCICCHTVLRTAFPPTHHTMPGMFGVP